MRYTIGCALALLTAAAIAGSAPAHAGTYQKLFSFKGRNGGSSPQAGLLQVGNLLYGTAIDSGGTVFAFRPKTGDERVRYRFDGGQPQAPVIDVGGTLYGTTVAGGLGQYGTVYAVHPKTGKGQILYAFKGDADGYFPEAGLLNVGGTLYGTTIGGGASIGGTVFAYTIATGAKRIVYSFTDGPSDGAASHASLIEVNGLLYGTTTEGGPATEGSVFAVDPNTGAEKIIYFFTGGSDGGAPYGGLINIGGLLYGTTTKAGSNACFGGCGTVFSVNPATGTETTLYTFQGGADGANPSGDLLKVGNLLYGTTGGGGGACSAVTGCGTVYSINLQTAQEKILYAFQNGTDGAFPVRSLIDYRGTLYGTTYQGGVDRNYKYPCNFGCGTIYSYTP